MIRYLKRTWKNKVVALALAGIGYLSTFIDGDGNNIRICAAIVDGKKIKADTWYTVKKGKFVEVKEN